jgi:hypothetical protein
MVNEITSRMRIDNFTLASNGKDKVQLFYITQERKASVRYHSGGSMKLKACILILAHMVYL